ncbi:hypothetical protein DdX_07195 [Ditylenchus destructor]|uniref:Uncharacterized protein n=1 Tax=Ditylenchus destructor TaxID=166010 RepID=A0AAD4N6X8_9BILA|nr:hypothetical protein DdX_07195 [Ditylenchus destructor]
MKTVAAGQQTEEKTYLLPKALTNTTPTPLGDRAYGHCPFDLLGKFAKIEPEENLEGSLPFDSELILTVDDVASLNYVEPRPRNSQINLDKNAEPPWDPDPNP